MKNISIHAPNTMRESSFYANMSQYNLAAAAYANHDHRAGPNGVNSVAGRWIISLDCDETQEWGDEYGKFWSFANQEEAQEHAAILRGESSLPDVNYTITYQRKSWKGNYVKSAGTKKKEVVSAKTEKHARHIFYQRHPEYNGDASMADDILGVTA